jgi:methyl-accepting chemotaxis protein
MRYIPTRPQLDGFFNKSVTDIEMPKYEDDKSPIEMLEAQTAFIEQTSKELHDIAESAKMQAESAKEIAESSKAQSETAVKTSSKADIKGWIAVTVSVLAFIWSIISHFI